MVWLSIYNVPTWSNSPMSFIWTDTLKWNKELPSSTDLNKENEFARYIKTPHKYLCKKYQHIVILADGVFVKMATKKPFFHPVKGVMMEGKVR